MKVKSVTEPRYKFLTGLSRNAYYVINPGEYSPLNRRRYFIYEEARAAASKLGGIVTNRSRLFAGRKKEFKSPLGLLRFTNPKLITEAVQNWACKMKFNSPEQIYLQQTNGRKIVKGYILAGNPITKLKLTRKIRKAIKEEKEEEKAKEAKK